MLERLNGIFAFAIWDRCKQRLFLARESMGIKPLYHAETPRGFLFASEMKALLADKSACRASGAFSRRRSIEAFAALPVKRLGEQNLGSLG